jgi:hypothetical protein
MGVVDFVPERQMHTNHQREKTHITEKTENNTTGNYHPISHLKTTLKK